MTGTNETGKWSAAGVDTENLTPKGFCDVIKSCFLEAQKETLKFGQEKLGLWKEGDDVEKLVDGALMMAFSEVGCRMSEPTFEGCRQVVIILAKGAAAWGTPKEIVRHHMGELDKIVVALGLEPLPDL